MSIDKDMPKFAVGEENGKPVCVYDTATNDVVAYIPNGKTLVTMTGNECENCTAADRQRAQQIADALNKQHSPGQARCATTKPRAKQ